jgi:hypothetical protein
MVVDHEKVSQIDANSFLFDVKNMIENEYGNLISKSK